jgi:transcriptional regulator with XRE-family HTH domain
MAARVRRARQLRAWTQVELAERSGLSQQTVQAIETGRRGVEGSIETIWRLAWALGTSIDMLVGLPELRGDG